MKRENFIRIVSNITIVFIVFMGCNKNDDNDIATSSVSVINAKLPDGDEYNDWIAAVKLLVNYEKKYDPVNQKYIWQGVEVAKGDYHNGGFSIKLPDNVDNLKPFDYPMPPKATMSKGDVMSAKSILVAYDKDDEQVGYFYYIHFFFCEETIVESGLFYFDRDFTITGSGTENESPWSFNCNFKKGWNFLYSINSSSNGIQIVKMTTSEPNCMYWNFRTNDDKY